uniref:Aldehyde oxidase/xanthine dehydrogenase second molybdopterin binding domain-containing protein n=1 Tax=Zea mays TaxID=4577 RepID=A0A804QWH1_MAIZE
MLRACSVYEEYTTNNDGLMISNSTWDYKIPSVDIIPKQFNAEVLNTGYHKNHVLSSKASGEPALVLASSVHCALQEAIRAARVEFADSSHLDARRWSSRWMSLHR